jgi:hypothetical protein
LQLNPAVLPALVCPEHITGAAGPAWVRDTHGGLELPRFAVDDEAAVPLILRWYTSAMPRGQPSPKVAITIDPDVHAGVVAAAKAEGVSISAWLTDAARLALKVRDGLAAVAEWEVEHGAFTPEELAAARRRVARQAGRKTA